MVAITAGTADGYIRIDTAIDSKGFNQGTKKMSEGFAKFGQSLKAFFKALSIGALLVLGASLRSLFGSIRDSISNLISTNLKGTPLAKDIEGIKNQFTELQFSIAAAFLPLIQFAVPYIKIALDWLIKLFNQIAMITAAFLGQSQVVQVVSGSAADLAKNTQKAEKAAKGALAAFDQINVLQTPTDSGVATTAELPKVLTQMVPVTNEIMEKVQAIKDLIGSWWNDPIGKIQETWGNIKDWFFANVIMPIRDWWMGTWIGQEIAGAWDSVKKNFVDPFSVGFWNIIESTKTLFTGLWATLTDDSLTTSQKIQQSFGLINDWLVSNFKPGIDGILNSLFVDNTTGANFKTNIFDPLSVGFFTLVESTKTLFLGLWSTISSGSLTVPEKIKAVFSLLFDWIRVNFIDPFMVIFDKALDFVGQKFGDIFEGVRGFVKGVINNIIDIVNGMVEGVISGINSVINAANSVGNLLPGFSPIGSISAPQIPGLATGAVIPPNAQFLAMLGDQKSGKNIEAPADLIRQIVREEMQGAGSGEMTVNMPVYLDNELIYDGQQKVQMRRGNSLIKSGVTK
jgi:hypothetical protein